MTVEGVLVAVAVAVFAFVGIVATGAAHNAPQAADAWPAPAPLADNPVEPSPAQAHDGQPLTAPAAPAAFPSDDMGFIDSSARCQRDHPALAIGRTEGSLVVICGGRSGDYEYLGVRLSDAAMLRTDAQTGSKSGFLAKKDGVLYAVSPAELKVTAGDTVIKQEPMIEYRQLAR
ncbi:hypothetical protein DVS77_06885 [Mycolicibacterium moriokaense]|nr:hypothetical protein DVS77_06885 [Mycolicibacterium moriokaense]